MYCCSMHFTYLYKRLQNNGGAQHPSQTTAPLRLPASIFVLISVPSTPWYLVFYTGTHSSTSTIHTACCCCTCVRIRPLCPPCQVPDIQQYLVPQTRSIILQSTADIIRGTPGEAVSRAVTSYQVTVRGYQVPGIWYQMRIISRKRNHRMIRRTITAVVVPVTPFLVSRNLVPDQVSRTSLVSSTLHTNRHQFRREYISRFVIEVEGEHEQSRRAFRPEGQQSATRGLPRGCHRAIKECLPQLPLCSGAGWMKAAGGRAGSVGNNRPNSCESLIFAPATTTNRRMKQTRIPGTTAVILEYNFEYLNCECVNQGCRLLLYEFALRLVFAARVAPTYLRTYVLVRVSCHPLIARLL